MNAAVFPVPVWAHQNMSAPFSARGIACSWIGLGCLYQIASSALQNVSETQISEKFVIRKKKID
jgi:hypothetical protein